MTAPRIALLAFLAATAIVHGLVAWWTPVQGDDWLHWVWAAEHADEAGLAWLASFARTHFTFADIASYVLAREPLVHVIVSPLVIVALVVGLFVLAERRMPRAAWDDVLVLALAASSIWVTQPRAGLTLFHIPYVGLYVWGVTLAVWFVAPLRCGWRVPRPWWPLLLIAGYGVGTSSRAIATATLVGFIVGLRAVPRDRRASWMWIALIGLVIGVVVGYVDPPWIEFSRVVRRGFEANLTLFRMPFEEAGELVSLVAALALLNLMLGALKRPHATAGAAPDPRDTLRWLVAWFGTAVWCLFGPRFGEATLIAATACLVVAAVPYLRWLAGAPVLRVVLIALAIGVHAVVWTLALRAYLQLGLEGHARLATLQRTPPGEMATVQRYSRITPDFWFLGEDMATASARQQVAIGVFGLRDIELVPEYRRYEPNPRVSLKLEVDDVSEAQLRAARTPTFWASELSVARRQFADLVERLRAVIGREPSARLAVFDVSLPERGSRPLLAAWSVGPELVAPKIVRGAAEQYSLYTIRVYPPHGSRFTEAWVIADGEARTLTISRGTVRLQPMHTSLHVIVLCNPSHCLVADAFTPRF